MTPRLYDARGNRYLVLPPDADRPDAVDLARAARLGREAGSDGALVGPFSAGPPFDLVIVNTDGTRAERSGNGLTIFARALTDAGLAPAGPFLLRVHHGGADTPLEAPVEPARFEGRDGFWVDMGVPEFGPAAAGAAAEPAGDAHRVAALAALDPGWTRSVLVRLGNPHCVTFAAALPEMEALRAPPLYGALRRIAFAGSPVAPRGINLQWARPAGPQRLEARVFERGEGPTASSGSSATAVACAARQLGLVGPGEVRVAMPGGEAPVRLGDRCALFGEAAAV